jgi:hypothetical protein
VLYDIRLKLNSSYDARAEAVYREADEEIFQEIDAVWYNPRVAEVKSLFSTNFYAPREDGNVTYINGEQIVKVTYNLMQQHVILHLSDGSKEEFTGVGAAYLISLMESQKPAQ